MYYDYCYRGSPLDLLLRGDPAVTFLPRYQERFESTKSAIGLQAIGYYYEVILTRGDHHEASPTGLFY